mmetsp:Transcript_20181/g.43974  ORF Transcript_20181/g.43974 Transcript_20181/m.43974 type:complete len:206 (+) Transcript_20181:1373-1990(+)
MTSFCANSSTLSVAEHSSSSSSNINKALPPLPAYLSLSTELSRRTMAIVHPRLVPACCTRAGMHRALNPHPPAQQQQQLQKQLQHLTPGPACRVRTASGTCPAPQVAAGRSAMPQGVAAESRWEVVMVPKGVCKQSQDGVDTTTRTMRWCCWSRGRAVASPSAVQAATQLVGWLPSHRWHQCGHRWVVHPRQVAGARVKWRLLGH